MDGGECGGQCFQCSGSIDFIDTSLVQLSLPQPRRGPNTVEVYVIWMSYPSQAPLEHVLYAIL